MFQFSVAAAAVAIGAAGVARARASPQHMAADAIPAGVWRVAAACALAATLVFVNTFTASFVYDDK
jgi:hypothetical protein